MFGSPGGIAVPLDPPSIDNGAHGTKKLLLKVKILHSEVNLIT